MSGAHRRSRLKGLFRPPGALAAAIVLTSGALVSLCLGGVVRHSAVTYFSYLYSAYGLAVLCACVPGLFRRGRDGAEGWLDRLLERWPKLAPAVRFLRDAEYRARLLLYPSLAMNLLFAAFKLGAGLVYRSAWLMGVGIYYAVLAGLRFNLLRTFLARRDPDASVEDWRLYRQTGLRLLALTLAMLGLTVQMVLRDRAYNYPGPLIYAFALHAFVKIGVATTALLRHRADDNPVLAASRSLSFACALMSVLALQTALLRRFSDDAAFIRAENASTGAIVCLLMLLLCATMLKRCKK